MGKSALAIGSQVFEAPQNLVKGCKGVHAFRSGVGYLPLSSLFTNHQEGSRAFDLMLVANYVLCQSERGYWHSWLRDASLFLYQHHGGLRIDQH